MVIEQTIERLVVDELAEVLRVGLEVLEPPLAHHLRGALAMGGVDVAAEGEGQLSRLHAGARFAHDLQAAALRAADADDAHDEAIVGGRLRGRALLLGGQELPGIPGRQPRGGECSQEPLQETTPRQIPLIHVHAPLG